MLDESLIMALRTDCHHHLRNIWIGAIVIKIAKYLNNILSLDLANINFRYRVTTKMDAVLRAVDKDFSLPTNYPKGHGDQFKYWLHKYHPGVLLVAVERTSGSRQDLAVEGAAAIYWNRKYYVEFLNQRLKASGENILQNNLFIVLSCMEMISMSRIFAIFHLCISMPMRWLAGNTHKLQTSDWSIRSMGRVIDLLGKAMITISNDGSKMLCAVSYTHLTLPTIAKV